MFRNIKQSLSTNKMFLNNPKNYKEHNFVCGSNESHNKNAADPKEQMYIKYE